MPDTRKDPHYNTSGYRDETAFLAMRKIGREENEDALRRIKKFLTAIRAVAEAMDLEIDARYRIPFIDRKTGREFR